MKCPYFFKSFLTICFFQILFVTQCTSQDNGLPFWDYRSNNFLSSTIGIGLQYDEDNQNVYTFIRVEYSPTKDIYRNINGHELLYQWQFNTPLVFELKLNRDYKKYGVLTDNKRGPRSESKVHETAWSYNIRLDFLVETLFFRAVNESYLNRNEGGVGGMVFTGGYSLHNTLLTGPLRKLSNTNGRITLGLRNLSDLWNAQLYLQNDFWIFLFKDDIPKHDHGNTTEYGANVYFRFGDLPFEHPEAPYEKSNKVYLKWWLEIITGRKVSNNSSTASARLGYFDVNKATEDLFRTYSRFTGGYESNYLDLEVGLLFNNPVRGRNLQRWGHQGRNHKVLNERSRVLGFMEKNNLFFSDYDFTSNSDTSRRMFLKYVYKNGNELLLEKFDSFEHLQKFINSHSTKALRKLYKKNTEDCLKLFVAYNEQLTINRYRYKKSRSFETTPLFPWERPTKFYVKPVSIDYFNFSGFKRTFK